jgi:hypothetical protein
VASPVLLGGPAWSRPPVYFAAISVIVRRLGNPADDGVEPIAPPFMG